MHNDPADPPLSSCATMRRIVVVGTSGSGKSTLARQLGSLLNIPSVECDALFWEPNWTQASWPVLHQRLATALSGDAWVVDGNYRTMHDLTWDRADSIVWLDYSLWVVMTRLLRRTFIRVFFGTELWNGNRERLSNAIFSKDSILLWALQTHARNRVIYTELTSQPQYAHLTIVRLRSPRATRLWLAQIKKAFAANAI